MMCKAEQRNLQSKKQRKESFKIKNFFNFDELGDHPQDDTEKKLDDLQMWLTEEHEAKESLQESIHFNTQSTIQKLKLLLHFGPSQIRKNQEELKKYAPLQINVPAQVMIKGNDMQQRTIDWSKIRFENPTPGQTGGYKFYEFPTQFMREQFQKTKEDVWLAGFFINEKTFPEVGFQFHFVLSNDWTTYKSVQSPLKKVKQKGANQAE